MPQRYTHDVLVIGSGAAGLSVAIQVADRARVAVICKGELGDGSTSWAQGGIAAVLDDEDTIDSHVADTLRAGAGLCHEDMVRFTVEHSRESIQWLVDLGVGFTKLVTPGGDSEFHLTMEGGHSHRRIIHAADATGRAVSDTLIEQARRHADIRAVRTPHRGQPDHDGRTLSRRLRAEQGHGLRRPVQRALRGAGHRRRQQGLPLYHQSGHRDRRRHRDGLARGLPGREHGVQPVPSDLPLSPEREILPDLGSRARRGRHTAAAERRALHAALPSRRPSWRRATSWRARSTTR